MVCVLHIFVCIIVFEILYDRILVVKMPSPQYYIELDNSTVASFDTATSTAEGLLPGMTELKLKGHSILCSQLFLITLNIYHIIWIVCE